MELWYFSIVDVIANPRKHWSVLKTRLKKEAGEAAANCSRLKLIVSDGRKCGTKSYFMLILRWTRLDVADIDNVA